VIYRSRAPVRIDLAGGWTDVPPFAEREGGIVVIDWMGLQTRRIDEATGRVA